jgi:hypothetical protein
VNITNQYFHFFTIHYQKLSMDKIYFALLCVLVTTVAVAQEKVDATVIDQIKNEEAMHSQIENIAHYLLDVCGSRLTNSDGYRRALNYTTQTFKQWGLSNAGPEAWGEFGKGWNNVHNYIALKAPYSQPMIGYAIPWTQSTNGLISAPVIMIDNLDSASIDKAGDALKGKIVIISTNDTTLTSPFKVDAERFADSQLNKLPDTYMTTEDQIKGFRTRVMHLYYAKRYLQEKGALALLSTSRSSDGTVIVQGTLTYHRGYEPPLPQMAIAKEDYLKLRRFINYGQEVFVEMDIQNTWNTDDISGYNSVAEIPGTDPKLKAQVVMIGGHLDSWHSGTGATDDGAGCIIMMEAIRILQALHVQPKRTIRIALWGAEEEGLLGSYGYVKKHFGDAKDMQLKPEAKNISVYFNLDNGSGKIRGVFMQNNQAAAPIFKDWLQSFASMGATGITLSNSGSTDHLSFDAVGIPAFQFIQDQLDYESRTHHSNMDVYDHLNFDDMKQAATIVAAFVYNAAMRDEMIPRKPLPQPEEFMWDSGLIKN